MPQAAEYRVGSEFSAWFQKKFQKRISHHLSQYIAKFEQFKRHLGEKSRSKEKSLSQLEEEWLDDTPSRLTNDYQIAAPKTARRGSMIHLELRTGSDKGHKAIGHFTAPLGQDGRISDPKTIKWSPVTRSGAPWPQEPKKIISSIPGESDGVEEVAGMLNRFAQFGENLIGQYNRDRPALFDGFDRAGGQPQGRNGGPGFGQMPGTDGFGISRETQGGGDQELVTGEDVLKKEAADDARDAFEKFGRTFDRQPPASIKADSMSDLSAKGRKRVVQRLRHKSFAKKRPKWYQEIRYDIEGGEDILEQILTKYGVPVYMYIRERKDTVSPPLFWRVLSARLVDVNLLRAGCDKFNKEIPLTKRGICGLTDCRFHPSNGSSVFKNREDKTCTFQRLKTKDKRIRRRMS